MEKSPIKSGWRGHINGHIENTSSEIEVSQVTVRLDRKTAWALANLLTDTQLEESNNIEGDQRVALASFGAALGRLIDHPAANNGTDREVVR
jgi:hypothetical protein